MYPTKYRCERVHQIDAADYPVLRSRLRALLKIDPHAGAKGGYRVRSLYFAGADGKKAQDQEENARHRDLFRLRFYDNDLSHISLEKKSVNGALCCKASVSLSLSQCTGILRGRWRWLRGADEPLLRELYWQMELNRLRPATAADCWREPFYYPAGGVRITLDSRIQNGLAAADFTTLALPAAASDGFMVLVIKYEESLPDFVRSALQLEEARPFSGWII